MVRMMEAAKLTAKMTVLLGATILPLVISQAAAQQSFELRSGVVIDPDKHIAYVMTPENRIDAIRLSNGQAQWSSSNAAKPIALKDHKLISQLDTRNPGELPLAVLTAESGQLASQIDVPLPRNVVPSIDTTKQGLFELSAQADHNQVNFVWEYDPQELVSALPEVDVRPDRTQSAGGAAAGASEGTEIVRGTFRVDIASGDVDVLPRDILPETPGVKPSNQGRAAVTLEDRIPGLAGLQFVSADGQHILNSEPIPDNNVGQTYLWHIYNRSTGSKIGDLRSPRPVAPFFMDGDTIVFEEELSIDISNNEAKESPLRLRAVKLANGTELWSVPIRDTRYFGPLPQ
jgi:hypothetical protein